MPAFMLYGCTGYTGRLVAEHAKSLGLDFIIAGRSENGARALAAQLDVRYCAFDLGDVLFIDASLKDVSAREAKVMLMPGCGGSVAMLGCLAGRALERVERPVSIDIALYVAGPMSRGSVVSAAEGGLATQCLERVWGTLAQKQDPTAATSQFDFGDGKGQVACFPVTLPDLITIWKSTKVPNIRTFVHASGNALPAGDLVSLPDGPTAQERAASPYHACVVVTSDDGSVKRAVLHTVNGYTFTSQASVEAVKRVLRGEVAGGFQTPAGIVHPHTNPEPRVPAIWIFITRSRKQPPTCARCFKRFTQRSSLVRHRKRCIGGVRAPSRQKACRQCTSAKVRCDLQHPTCGRCLSRSFQGCEYLAPRNASAVRPPTPVQLPAPSDDGSSPEDEDEQANTASSITAWDEGGRSTRAATDNNTPLSAPDTESRETFLSRIPEGIPSELVVSQGRRQILLGKAPDTPNHDLVVRHTMHFVIRVLRSWPRMMAAHHTAQLPPPIHRLQLVDGVPTPLANCYALVKMWSEHTDGSRELVKNTILHEIQRLLGEYTTYNEDDLLAAAQSLLIMLIMLLFGMTGPSGGALAHPADAQLLVRMWDVKEHLSRTGLLLDQEAAHTVPPSWRQWAMVAAKRKTIHSFHHVEWAWSLLHGYPVLTCFELAPLPAPPARYLWQEADDESRWRSLYVDWLAQWKGGFYRMMEFFHINPGGALDSRSELWLAEADEFGMMVMAEGKCSFASFSLASTRMRPHSTLDRLTVY
ncbi:hypothetical protein B0I37DRAFT_398312 [Chaetomium sp. MPI-CAGE-AT-0009]|nr:hypothetical protein B0I37DRAFT_398312 [Chaetomium sp. MPI-CAGE-AT-0009]